jgi:dipeptidyl-peptidase 4
MRRAALTLVAGLIGLGAIAQEKREITVEWIYSDEGDAVDRLPETYWTSTNELLLLDPRKPENERTIERVRPDTGERTPAVDSKAAVASLGTLLDDAPKSLEWPVGFDGAGRAAVYLYQADLFRLDLASSRFERLTRTSEAESAPRLSPDGTKLAFVRANDLFVLDLGKRAETRLTTDGSPTILNGALSWVYWEEIFDHADAGFWWSEDSTAIAFLRTDDSPVSVIPFVDFTPAVPRVIRQAYPKAGGANPLVRLGVVEIESRKTTWVDTSEVPYEYVIQVKWLPDSHRIAFETLNRRQDRTDVYLMDRSSGACRRILTESDPAWVNDIDFQFLADGHVLATSDRDGHTHLYRYTLEGERVNSVTKGPWSVRGPTDWQLSPLGAAVVDEARGVVYFTAREKSPLERHLYRVGLDGSGMRRLSKEDGAHAISWSPDRLSYLDVHSSHATMPSLSLHDSEGGTKAVLAPSGNDRLAPFQVQYPEMLTIPAEDGFPLPARIFKPKGFDPKRRYPVIVNVYGEPNSPLVKDAWTGATLFNQILLRQGYLVVNVDPRSATGVSKALENTVLGRVGGDVELRDLVAAARWIKAQTWADPARLGIWGWSGGGTATLLAVTRSTEWKAAIAVAPVTDRAYYDTKYAEAFMKTPQENPEGYEYVSLVKRAKDLHGRLLLVHGTYDDNVHPQNTWAFADELVKAGKPFDMMIYPMRKHGIGDRAARRHLYNKVLEFWKLYL